MFVEKTQVFGSQEEWDKWRKKYCKDNRYETFRISAPTHFPCMGIRVVTPEGDLGQIISIEEFVYLSDFGY